MSNIFGAQGVYPTPRGQASMAFDLQPGQARIIPSGTWFVDCGPYTCVQELDPIQGQWISPGGGGQLPPFYINSDGFNYRVVNLSGCVVGAAVTTAGSGYSAATPPVVSVSVGGATFTAIVGGAVSTSVTVTNGGTNYTYPPIVVLDSPPLGAGYQATATCALTAGAVSSVTVNNQGAGYTNVPNIYFIPDPRDITGSGAAATAVLTGAGTVTQLLLTNHGLPQTTLQPTISFSSGAAAAFPIMVRSVSGITLSNVGSGYSGNVIIQGVGTGYAGGANVLTNPKWTTSLVRTRASSLIVGVDAATKLTSAGTSLLDGGVFAGSSPTAVVIGANQGTIGTGAITAVAAFTYGNSTDTITLQPV